MPSESFRISDPNEILRELANAIARLGGDGWIYDVETGMIASKDFPSLEFVQILVEPDAVIVAVQSRAAYVHEFLGGLGFHVDRSSPNLPPLSSTVIRGGWKELGLKRISDVLRVAIQLARLSCSPDTPYIQLLVTSDPLKPVTTLAAGDIVANSCFDKDVESLRSRIAAKVSTLGRTFPELTLVDSRQFKFEERRALLLPKTPITESGSVWIDDLIEDARDGFGQVESVKVRIPKTAHDFEVVCCEFLTEIGCEDAALTRSGPDGGVDVVSSELIAQAKFHPSQKITVEVVRALAGSRLQFGKDHAFLFHYGPGFTRDAIAAAQQLNILLFELDVDNKCFRIVGSGSREL